MQMFNAIRDLLIGFEKTILEIMGITMNKGELSAFQKSKLLHEFHTFFDLNKDGVLEWKDFEVARERVCEISGWKVGSDMYIKTKLLFAEIWRYLQDDGDTNLDGRMTSEEWLRMWEKLNQDFLARKREKNPEKQEDKVPDWLDRYIEYKFHLFDRTADGAIDLEEFEYVLSDFNVSAKDARTAFLLFSANHEHKVDLPYFRQLSLEFFRSDDQSDLGNFITGRLDFT
ncbi:unnamed protein product [Lymnaea stagnalis]|uniref:EF-hand domain-containing protein n=1 Tax=Lymnaea stagnalis TaxID=6523 RepID=A0AAV2HSW9_LYMST